MPHLPRACVHCFSLAFEPFFSGSGSYPSKSARKQEHHTDPSSYIVIGGYRKPVPPRKDASGRTAGIGHSRRENRGAVVLASKSFGPYQMRRVTQPWRGSAWPYPAVLPPRNDLRPCSSRYCHKARSKSTRCLQR